MTVDILLPYYGDVALMQEAVRSVLDQDSPDWRLVVLDDGYPDPAVAEWFGTLDDDRVEYERNEKNLGANGNYRKSLTRAENPVVTVMGADDVLLPGYVRTVADAFSRHPDVSFFQPGVEVIDETGARSNGLVDRAKAWYRPRVDGELILRGESLATSLLRGNWTYFPSIAWRADVITAISFRTGLDVVQDLALALDIVLRDGALLVAEEPVFHYRRHRASDSSWRALEGTRFAEERKYFLQIASELDAKGWHRAARVARRHVSSRANAAMLLPSALRKRQVAGVRNLARHAFTSTVAR